MDSSTDPRQGLNFLIDDHTNVAIATTVYIIKEGKVLLMKQTKPHTVVDGYYVGIGGKTPIKTNLKQDREKVRQDVMVSSFLSGTFELKETMEDLAVREVKEEVGLTLHKGKLQDIGISEVRLLNQKSNEIWYIKNYIYYIDGSEGEITECDEGTLEFVPIDDIRTKAMLLHDRIIFGERNPSTYIQSMNDEIHHLKQLRICQEKYGKKIYIILPDFESKPDTVIGVVTEESYEMPSQFKMATKYIPENKLREYLKTLGISEKVVGKINKDNSPIEIDKYIK